MLLLCNKVQEQNNPLASFEASLCRQRSEYEWSASYMTPEVTVNLDLVQWCSVSVIPENKPLLQKFYQLIEIKLDFRFTKNFWFLVPISRGGKCPFYPPLCRRP